MGVLTGCRADRRRRAIAAVLLGWLLSTPLTLMATGAEEPQSQAAAPAALPSHADLVAALQGACEARMRQLRADQQDSLASVRWQQDAIGIHGRYVGYAPDYECTLSTPVRAVPAGRMHYRQIRFEKRGSSVAEAMRADPVPLEIEDVTQVLVYREGHWQ